MIDKTLRDYIVAQVKSNLEYDTSDLKEELELDTMNISQVNDNRIDVDCGDKGYFIIEITIKEVK